MIGQSMQNQNYRQHHPLRGDGFRQVLKKVRFRFGQSLQQTNIEDISTTIQGRDVCPDKLCVDANEFAPPIAVKEIGRAHVCTPVTTAQLVCRLLLEKKTTKT